MDEWQGNPINAPNWGPISMSSDGSKATAASMHGGSDDFAWVSIDGGETWTKTSEEARDVVITPDGSKFVAVVTGTVGKKIRLSTDDGATWTDTGSPDTVSWGSLATNGDGTKMAALGDTNSVYLSSDGGATWTAAGVTQQEWATVDMSADGTTIALGVNGGKIWISSDGGSTFTEAAASLETKWRAIDMTPDGSKIAAASQQGGVWVSSDGGTTWTEGIPADHKVFRGVAISDDGMTIVTNNCCNGENWISYDGGASFSYMHWRLNRYWEKIALSGDGSKVLCTSSGDGGRIYMGKATTTTVVTSTMTNTTTVPTMTTTVTVTSSVTMTETSTEAVDETGETSTTAGSTSAGSTSGGSADTTTTEDSGSNVVEVTLTLTVDDPAVITENATLTNAMIQGFADVMGVEASQVTLEFEVARRLRDRRLQVQLQAIFSVTFPDAAAAEESKDAIEAVSVADTNQAISDAVVGAGFGGTIEVTGKEAVIAVVPEGPTGGAMPALTVGVLTQLAIALLQA